MDPPYDLSISTDPASHAEDDEHHYRLALSAPGVAPADLSVTVHPDPRVHEVELAGSTTVHGRTYTIDKRIHLPRDAEVTEDFAPHVSLANGILTLTVRKFPDEAAATTTKLTIESSSSAASVAQVAEPEAMAE